MLTLFDYLPSQNAWKVRQLLHHLGQPHQTVLISIFEGEGRTDAFLRISPAGTVPAIRLDDGRVLAESNAILMYLASGTRYLPDDTFERAKIAQWLCFEQERVESVIGSLRQATSRLVAPGSRSSRYSGRPVPRSWKRSIESASIRMASTGTSVWGVRQRGQ